jgi:hypothetical protein
MKYFAVLFVLLLFSVCAGAQPLQARAGTDTARCTPPLNPINPRIGEPATGGLPPYTYTWSAINGGQNYVGLLDLQQSAQPHVVNNPPQFIDSLFFTVQVMDAANAVAYDTVLVRFSRWAWTLSQCMRFKGPADTVDISFQGGSMNFSPTVIEWSPASFLTTTSAQARSYTPTTQNYVAYGTDRAGCRLSAGQCSVIVSPAHIANAMQAESSVRFAPLPLTPDSRLEISAYLIGSTLHIYSVDGRLLQAMSLRSATTSLREILQLSSGTYFYCIEKSGKAIKRSTFTIQ